MAQWVARLLRKRKVPDSNPIVDKSFSFFISRCFAFLPVHANEINHDTQLVNTHGSIPCFRQRFDRKKILRFPEIQVYKFYVS